MIWTFAIISALLWALALVTDYTFGGYIHILLAVTVGLLLLAVFKAGGWAERRRGAERFRPSAPVAPVETDVKFVAGPKVHAKGGVA